MCSPYLFKLRQHQGFTVMELLSIIAILGVLAALAWPLYEKYVAQARLYNAQAALMLNAQFLERHYHQHARFTKNSTTWPKLPITETEFFAISFAGTARGTHANTYRLQAVAKDTDHEPRYLTLDQNHTLLLCHKENTRTICKIL